MPTVSILLAVHNGAVFLDEAVQSVIKQTYSDWELIAVENGSTDESAMILANWSRRDHRIKLVSVPERGKNNAFNIAFGLSTAPYICFFAADDILEPSSLSLRLAPLLENPTVDFTTCLLRTTSTEAHFNNLIFPRKRSAMNFSGGSILFRRALGKKIFPLPTSLPNEDFWAALHLRAFGSGVQVPVPLYNYRIHQLNSYGYHSRFEAKRQGFLERMKAHRLFVERRQDDLPAPRQRYHQAFASALDAAERFERIPILLATLPPKDKLLLLYYCSPTLFRIRQSLFRLLSGQIELVS